jgi:hypothetical protein
MKRDFDLIRRILLDVENMPPEGILQRFDVPEYDHTTIGEHVRLLIRAGLIRGEMADTFGGVHFVVSGLTWKGHDFLDAARDATIWKRAKDTILKPTASITFDLLFEWLKEQAKRTLGLP